LTEDPCSGIIRGQSADWEIYDEQARVFFGDPRLLIVAAVVYSASEGFCRTYHGRNQTPDGPALSLYVFHTDGRPVGDCRKAWASACKAAGLVKPKLDWNGNPVSITVNGKKETVMLPSPLFHDLRRSGVRNMVRAGTREGVAMAISGHRTRAIFDRYNITSDEDLRQAVKQTNEHLAAEPVERKVLSITK
jgi:hypothetical protein